MEYLKDIKEIGQRLQDRRKEFFKTQYEFAEALGIEERKTVGNWETGTVAIPIHRLSDICNLLDCDLDYLFGKIDVPKNNTADIMKETGLSQKAVENLIENKNSTDIRYINFLLEYGFVRGFFNEFSLYVNSDKITQPKNNNELSEILFDSDDKKLGDYIKDENNFTNHINMRCSYPLELRSSFDTGIFEKAIILEMQDRLRMIKDDITKSIKDGVKNG